jgi:hypothetical protein
MLYEVNFIKSSRYLKVHWLSSKTMYHFIFPLHMPIFHDFKCVKHISALQVFFMWLQKHWNIRDALFVNKVNIIIITENWLLKWHDTQTMKYFYSQDHLYFDSTLIWVNSWNSTGVLISQISWYLACKTHSHTQNYESLHEAAQSTSHVVSLPILARAAPHRLACSSPTPKSVSCGEDAARCSAVALCARCFHTRNILRSRHSWYGWHVHRQTAYH